MSEPRRSVQGMDIFTRAVPERDPLWSDPDLSAAYLAALTRDFELSRLPEEDDFLIPPDLEGHDAESLFDDMADLENTVRAARAASARQDDAFRSLLARADAEPDVWAGPDPTTDLLWRDPRGRSTSEVRAHRRNLAVRAAAADIGVRVQLTDTQVRSRAHRAATLATRTPRLWQTCLQGSVSEQNMAIAAELASSLPANDPEAWDAFDETIHEAAAKLTPGRFRQRARAARERIAPQSLSERHHQASANRYVGVDAALDGMAYFTALVPATAAYAADRLLDQAADDLAANPDETRTRQQLRADAFVDMITRQPDGRGAKITASVNITIPAMTLLNKSDRPATLDGYGPIPLETARALAADATVWFRVLTDPFTGTVLDVERRAYKVPADLRRWLSIRYPICIFPGCTRRAGDCDMDHRERWADGGTTSSINLGPACPRHHPVKDETAFRLERDPDTGQLRWITPTGFVADVDPPPF